MYIYIWFHPSKQWRISWTSVVRYFMPAILDCATQEELLTAPVANNDTPVSLLLFFRYGSRKNFADSVPIGFFWYFWFLVSNGNLWIHLLNETLFPFVLTIIITSFTLVSHVGCYEIRVNNPSICIWLMYVCLHNNNGCAERFEQFHLSNHRFYLSLWSAPRY